MKIYLIAASLLFAACSGSTSVDTEQIADEAEDSLEALTDPDVADEPADEVETDTSPAAASDDEEDEEDEDDDGSVTVSDIDDIPQVCKDLMADFLRDIEPIVSPVDWNTATLADFESITVEFEPIAEKFDVDSEATGECDDIDLDDDKGFDVLVEFAEDEAPGTVGFLSFISDFTIAALDVTAANGEAAFTTCEEAVAFMDGLMSQYDSVEEIPVAEITALANIATVIFTCTPEQMSYFDSPDVSAFFDSFTG